MKNRSFYRLNAVSRTVLLLLLAAIACSCAAPQVAPPPPPQIVEDRPGYHRDIQMAAEQMAGSLSRQLTEKANPSIPQVVVDVFFNEQSAEVSSSGKLLQEKMIEYLKRGTPPFPAFPLGGTALQKSRWVVLGSFRLDPQNSNKTAKWVKITSEVKDIKSDTVLAKSESFVDAQQFAASEPVRFYKDAPMYMTSQAKTRKNLSAGQPGQSFAERLAMDAKVADARNIYDSGDFTAAEKLFSEVATSSKDTNMVALSGLYQSQFRLKKIQDAESSFGRLVKAGLDSGNLSVKFLFRLNSTDFLPNSELNAQYPLWLRQIALQLSERNQCLDVNGHASKSGSAEFNERLSRQRAERIAQQLRRVKPALNSRLHAAGKGFSENIVGSGTNDGLDAIDRRVDFQITGCR